MVVHPISTDVEHQTESLVGGLTLKRGGKRGSRKDEKGKKGKRLDVSHRVTETRREIRTSSAPQFAPLRHFNSVALRLCENPLCKACWSVVDRAIQ